MNIIYKMSDSQKKDLFRRYDHLGTNYPFYTIKDSSIIFSTNIETIISEIPTKKRKIDPVGIIEIIGRSYLLADRTLIKNVKRTPWMGMINDSGDWTYSNVPAHSYRKMEIKEAAFTLKSHLKNELRKYVSNKSTIGILLSGGLDSRIVAGILRELQIDNEFKGIVVAFTWGIENSRDVLYANEICKKFNWEWKHLKLNADILKSNIYLAAELGAEFSPLHLHAMAQVREFEGIDAIIAGSYGDSVGRAEFSGQHLLNLDQTLPRNINKFGLIKSEIIDTYQNDVIQDAYGYKKYIKREKEYQYREIEQEMHYMRRKLQASISYISEKIPVYQLFTDPITFGFMWSLDPSIRENQIYEAILADLPAEVGSIPWARTGKSLDDINSDNSNTLKNHHKYGVWLRKDLNSFITDLVTSDNILNMGIFNEAALVRLLKLWPNSNTVTTNQIDEVISWIASLSLFVDRYKLNDNFIAPNNWKDSINSIYGPTYAKAYQILREKQRS